MLHERLFDVALVSEALLANDEPDLLRRLREADAALVVVTLGARASAGARGLLAGSFERIGEGASPAATLAALERASRHAALSREVGRLRGEVSRAGECDRAGAGTEEGPVCSLHSMLERVAGSDANALIVGERGIGKQSLARAIHRLGRRRNSPFVAIDCASLQADDLEARLFGHEGSACATEGRARPGLFRAAHGGTLYLGKIGVVDLSVQEALYRALSQGVFAPLGSDESTKVDVRVIASTDGDPKAMVSDGRLREDLYWALASLPVEVPPLRARPRDLPRLVAGILGARGCAMASALAPPLARGLQVTDRALARLEEHDWPGNARELVSLLLLASSLSDGETIRRRDLDAAGFRPTRASPERPAGDGMGPAGEETSREPIADAAAGRPLKVVVDQRVRDLERRAIVEALERVGGSPARAADLLGISRASIYYKIRDYGIRFQRPADD